jgi:hypothetical protein
MIRGLGSAAHILHRDLYKILSKTYLNDRVLRVRIAAINVPFIIKKLILLDGF